MDAILTVVAISNGLGNISSVTAPGTGLRAWRMAGVWSWSYPSLRFLNLKEVF